MDTEGSIKAYLDSLSQLPGSILWRDRICWKALAPGNAGQHLALNSSLHPEWVNSYSYAPPVMVYPSINGWYSINRNMTGNKFTLAFTFANNPRAGTNLRSIFIGHKNTNATRRFIARVQDSSSPFAANALTMAFANASGTFVQTHSNQYGLLDNQLHTVVYAVNGDTGEYFLSIDKDVKSPITTTPQTLNTGSINAQLGNSSLGSSQFWNGRIGQVFYDDRFIPDDSLFYDSSNRPVQIDTTLWTGFSGAPRFWNWAGDLLLNYGYDGHFTRYGNIAVDPGWAA